MKATRELITAFRNVANKIEQSTGEVVKHIFWDWNEPERCTMGLVARELGVTPEQIKRSGIVGYWFMGLEKHLTKPTRQLKDPLAIKARELLYTIFDEILFTQGLEPEDIKTIEFCGGEVLDTEDEYGIHNDIEESTEKVAMATVAWLRDKANLLEHELEHKQEHQRDLEHLECFVKEV